MARLYIDVLIGLAVALNFSFSVGMAFATDPGSASKSPKNMIVNRAGSPPTIGLRVITVWACAGGAMSGCNPVDEIKLGSTIMRYEIEKARGHRWAFIRAESVEGWVRNDYLLEDSDP